VTLPLQMGVYIASEVAKGLDHAHRRRNEQMRPLGIVHRDVSPQNVLLSFEGEVKVTDFGIAKARRVLEADAMENTQSRRLHGKFGYMSPEQARGDEVDAPSDLFSLGTVLYECVAGMNPFTAPTVVETLERVAACRFPPIEEIRQDVPPELAAIIKTAMAGNPGDRYADAGRMYESLLAILYAQGSAMAPTIWQNSLGICENQSMEASRQVRRSISMLPLQRSSGRRWRSLRLGTCRTCRLGRICPYRRWIA